MRRYAVVLRTKPDDVRYERCRTIRSAAGMDDPRHDRLILDPPYERQQVECAFALERAWRQGGWTVYVDELYYCSQMLRLGRFIDRLLTQGRSKGVSVLVGMQRPVQISRFALSQASHVLALRQEPRDAKTIGEATSREMESTIGTLGRYQAAWFDRTTRAVHVTDRDTIRRGNG